MVLTCGPLSLYQIHNPFMNVLAGLLVAAFSGLPYTPNVMGWFGLVMAPYSLKDLLFILVMIILMGGAFLHILRAEGRKFSDLEPWMRSVYPLGFAVSIATHVFVYVIGFDRQLAMGVPAASVVSFAGAVILAALLHRLPERFRTQNLVAWGRESVSFFWRVMKQLLDMEWLIAFGSRVTRAVRAVASEVSSVLENNGGLVWELLLMALLVAVVYSGALL